MNYGIKVKNIWTKSEYLYPVLYSTIDEAEKALKSIPQASGGNNELELIEIRPPYDPYKDPTEPFKGSWTPPKIPKIDVSQIPKEQLEELRKAFS